MNDNHDPRHDLVEALRRPLYGSTAAKAILEASGQKHNFSVDERGVWVIKDDVRPDKSSADVFEWHPPMETYVAGCPSPSTEPSLPFPFSASQLAAFMSGGAGYFVQEVFGEWVDGPDEEVLGRIEVQAMDAKEVLRGAYQAYRQALENVVRIDETLDKVARDLRVDFRKAEVAAKNLDEVGIGDDEYSQRHARAKDAVELLWAKVKEAELRVQLHHEAWRNAMVNWLLTPPDNPADFGAGTYGAGAGGAGASTTAGELAGVSSLGAEARAIEGGTNLLTRGATAPAYGSGVSSVAPQPAGPQHVPAQPQTHRTKGGRDDLLWPVIERAQEMAGGSVRPAEVWVQLQQFAIAKVPPLEGVNSGGIQYRYGKLETFTFAALRDRLRRRAKARQGALRRVSARMSSTM